MGLREAKRAQTFQEGAEQPCYAYEDFKQHLYFSGPIVLNSVLNAGIICHSECLQKAGAQQRQDVGSQWLGTVAIAPPDGYNHTTFNNTNKLLVTSPKIMDQITETSVFGRGT